MNDVYVNEEIAWSSDLPLLDFTNSVEKSPYTST
jgi:hypothetical protein